MLKYIYIKYELQEKYETMNNKKLLLNYQDTIAY